MSLILAEDDDAFFSELAAGTTVAADSLHIVSLLGDGGDNTTAYPLALHGAEEASDPLSPRPRLHDVVDIRFWNLEEDVRRQFALLEEPAHC